MSYTGIKSHTYKHALIHMHKYGMTHHGPLCPSWSSTNLSKTPLKYFEYICTQTCENKGLKLYEI